MDRELPLPAAARPSSASRRSPLSAVRRRRALRAARRAADVELVRQEVVAPAHAWRAAELVSPASRRALAADVRRLVRSADARYLPGATPLNRVVVREEAATLAELADRLADLGQTVTARGVLLLDQLLRDGYGPLFVAYRAGELRWTLQRIATLLTAAP